MPESSPNESTSKSVKMAQEAVEGDNPPIQPNVAATNTTTATDTIRNLLARNATGSQSLSDYVATTMKGQTPTTQLLANYHASQLLSSASSSSSPMDTSSSASTPSTSPDSPLSQLNLPYLFPKDIQLLFGMFRRDMDMLVQPAIEVMTCKFGSLVEENAKLAEKVAEQTAIIEKRDVKIADQKATNAIQEAKIAEQEAKIQQQEAKIAEQTTTISQHEDKIKEAVASHLQQQEREFETQRAEWETKEKFLDQQIVSLKDEKQQEQLVLLSRITELEQAAKDVDLGLLAEKTKMAARLQELETSSASKYQRISKLEEEANKREAENLEISTKLMNAQERLNFLEAEKAEVDRFVARRAGLLRLPEQQPAGLPEFTFNTTTSNSKFLLS